MDLYCKTCQMERLGYILKMLTLFKCTCPNVVTFFRACQHTTCFSLINQKMNVHLDQVVIIALVMIAH